MGQLHSENSKSLKREREREREIEKKLKSKGVNVGDRSPVSRDRDGVNT